MEKFIAISQQAREDLDHKIGQTSFRTVGEFIALYNDDLINKSAALVKDILGQLVDTYKDVEERSKKIIFLDPAEIYLRESLKELSSWELIVKIKREVQTALESGNLKENDTIVFTPQATGILCKLVEKEDGKKSFVKIGIEKLFNKPEIVEEVFRKYSSTGDGRDGTYSFHVEDFVNIDDSFIEKVHQIIPRG